MTPKILIWFLDSMSIKYVNKEAERLPFEIKIPSALLSALPPDKLELVKELKANIEKDAFIWGNFPVALPESALANAFSQLKVFFPLFQKH